MATTDFKLIKINQLDENTNIEDHDFILTEVRDPLQADRFKTSKMKAGLAFQTTNIRLTNAGNIQIDLNDPIFDGVRDQFPDQLESQDDANQLFSNVMTAMVDKVNQSTNIIFSPTPPTPLPAADGTARQYPEGTMWIDVTTYRTYVLYYNIDDVTQVVHDHYWIGLTDR